jgi:hypothetical protein
MGDPNPQKAKKPKKAKPATPPSPKSTVAPLPVRYAQGTERAAHDTGRACPGSPHALARRTADCGAVVCAACGCWLALRGAGGGWWHLPGQRGCDMRGHRVPCLPLPH